MNKKSFFYSRRVQIVFLVFGAIAGFLYWKFIGCTTGTCPIKSVWYWTTLWGAVMGYLVGDIIRDIIRKKKQRKEK
ncbi:MAG: hypothetical protein CSA36_05215 [Draconibacterium sp.]|nr:MAG: hypothetical protein CSA36_05215 [Draconibacterium sp.]